MWDWLSKLKALQMDGHKCCLVTVIDTGGSTPREAGAKMIVCDNGRFFGTIGGGNLEKLAIEDAGRILLEAQSKKIKYPLGAKTGQCCGGSVELFFEPVSAGPELYLFGAGHVGQALANSLIGTPFRVHVIDPRTEWVHHSALNAEVIKHECSWDEYMADPQVKWSADNTYVIVMTHDHSMDEKIIEDVVHRKSKFIGLIGSNSKWERFKQRYQHKNLDLGLFERVRCPIGIPVGGKAPQEIAISVAASLLKEHYGR